MVKDSRKVTEEAWLIYPNWTAPSTYYKIDRPINI